MEHQNIKDNQNNGLTPHYVSNGSIESVIKTLNSMGFNLTQEELVKFIENKGSENLSAKDVFLFLMGKR